MSNQSIAELRAELRHLESIILDMSQAKRDLGSRVEAAEADLQNAEANVSSAEAGLHAAILSGSGEVSARDAVRQAREARDEAHERLGILRTGLAKASDSARQTELTAQAVSIRKRMWRALAAAEVAKIPAAVIATLQRAHAMNRLGIENLVNPTLGGFAATWLAQHDLHPDQLRQLQETLAREHDLPKFRP